MIPSLSICQSQFCLNQNPITELHSLIIVIKHSQQTEADV